MDYQEFLNQKKQIGGMYGFKTICYPDKSFDFQKYLIDYACQKGRSAIFADTGLGKTNVLLSWADNVSRYTNKNVLILTPLAVSFQTIIEGEKFGIEVKRSRDGHPK